jgi:hypothetical protein
MKCCWCYQFVALLPLKGEVGKVYGRCPFCANFVPLPREDPEVELYVAKYSEKHRRLIFDAVEFLDKREAHWQLDAPIDRDEFIANLVERTNT